MVLRYGIGSLVTYGLSFASLIIGPLKYNFSAEKCLFGHLLCLSSLCMFNSLFELPMAIFNSFIYNRQNFLQVAIQRTFINFVLTKDVFSSKYEKYIFEKFLIKGEMMKFTDFHKVIKDYIDEKDIDSVKNTMKYFSKLKHYKDIIFNSLNTLLNNTDIVFNDEIIDILIESLNRKDIDRLYLICLFNSSNSTLFYVDYYERVYPDYLPILKIDDKVKINKQCLQRLEYRENFDDFISLNKDNFDNEETREYIENLV